MAKHVYPSSLPYPFSAAVRTGNLLFVSGQVGVRDGKTGAGIEEQTRFTLENMRDVLAQAGATLADVVKVTVFTVEGISDARSAGDDSPCEGGLNYCVAPSARDKLDDKNGW